MRKLVIVSTSILLIAACARAPLLLTPMPTPTPISTRAPTPSPTSTPTLTPTCAPIVCVVEAGDTLDGIAALYETTADAICAFNELSDCSLIYPGDELQIPCEGVTPTAPTPSPTPTHTPMPMDTPTPTPTPTPLLTPTPTNTRVVPLSTPTPVFTLTPTSTATPPYEFLYEEGSMQTEPNCSTVYLKINVVGVGGEPVNDIAVRLQWAGFTDHKITGRGEPAGEVGFAPLGPDSYHSPIDFHIRLVQSPSDPTPRSNEKIVHFTDCATAGAFTNIKFVYQW